MVNFSALCAVNCAVKYSGGGGAILQFEVTSSTWQLVGMSERLQSAGAIDLCSCLDLYSVVTSQHGQISLAVTQGTHRECLGGAESECLLTSETKNWPRFTLSYSISQKVRVHKIQREEKLTPHFHICSVKIIHTSVLQDTIKRLKGQIGRNYLQSTYI